MANKTFNGSPIPSKPGYVGKVSQSIRWDSSSRATLRFDGILSDLDSQPDEPSKHRPAYRVIGIPPPPILKGLLHAHGFSEEDLASANLIWNGSRILEQQAFRFLRHFQKINRFPRTTELCHDRLFANVTRMRQSFSNRHFDFVPTTFVLPQEFHEVYDEFLGAGGRWILRTNGDQTRIIESLAEVPMEERCIIQRYVDRPLLIGGRKFDIRVFVAVTSFSPLRIYMYDEGLCRYAAEPFNPDHIYSGYGHFTGASARSNKTLFSSLLGTLEDQFGLAQTSLLIAKIKDVVIKSLISVESLVTTALNMCVPFPQNCFELFAFDIVVDEQMVPWLLKITTNPSLSRETSVDLTLKVHMLADLLTLVGISPPRAKSGSAKQSKKPKRPVSASSPPQSAWDESVQIDPNIATPQNLKMIKTAKEEQARSGRFTRIFPCENTGFLYSVFFGKNSPDVVLHKLLFGKFALVRPSRTAPALKSYPVPVSATEESDLDQTNPDSAPDENSSPSVPGRRLIEIPVLVPSAAEPDGEELKEATEKMTKKVTIVDPSDRREKLQPAENQVLEKSFLQKIEEFRKLTKVSEVISTGTTEQDAQSDLRAKIDARVEFEKFLGTVLERLNVYYENSDPSLCLDKSLVQRQLDVLDRFLKQSAHMKEGLIWTCESPLLSDRLGAFIKGYHNETDRLLNMRQQKEAHQEYTAEIQMGTVNGVRELATTTPDLKQGEPPQKPAESENKDDRLSAQERLDQLFKALLVKNPTTQSSRSISSSSLNSSVQPSNAQSSARSSRPSSASSRRGLERNAIALRNTNKMVRQAQSELQRLVQPQQPQMRHPSSALRLQPSQLINNRNTLPRGSLYPSETWLGLRAGAGGFEDGFYLAGQSIKGGSTLKLN